VRDAAVRALLPRPYTIRRRVRETHDTFTLELATDDDGFAFEPGQFNMLYVFGSGEVPVSISGDPGNPGKLVHTIRALGPVTRALGRLRAAGVLGVRGPFGQPWPLGEAAGKDVVLVAGGIGLAPLRPALYEIAARRRDFGRVVLLHGARSPEDTLFRRELERWRESADIAVSVSVDHATRGWPGDVGVVTALVPRAPFDGTNAVALLCGPEVMMRFAADALARRGIPAERQFVSMERNMKCAVGFCGHCQFGSSFVCKDGPVFPYARVRSLLALREV
jgi:NAD(P)H-flavin reductase